MHIPFSKYSGTGNDFILIDRRSAAFPSFTAQEVASLCHRRLGIGADGVIVAEAPERAGADVKMRIFNADGNEAEMCGNGVRCLAQFLKEKGYAANEMNIETMHYQLDVVVHDADVSVRMPPPSGFRPSVRLKLTEAYVDAHYLDTGVPHVVIFVDDIEDSRLMAWAPEIRFHPEFFPRGANVNFVSLGCPGTILVRTYERGVEAETLACGTGASAVACVMKLLYAAEDTVTITPRSQQKIEFVFSQTGSDRRWSVNNCFIMKAPAHKIYSGIFSRDFSKLHEPETLQSSLQRCM